MNVLVIGSRGYGRAQSVDWMQPFPNLEDQDALIIDLRFLDQGQLDRLFERERDKMDGMIEQILTLLSNDKNVYCIMRQHTVRTPPIGAARAYVSPPDSNYRWLPFPVAFQSKSGNGVDIVVDLKLESYLKFVDKWDVEVLGFYRNGSLIESGRFSIDWFRGISPPSPQSMISASMTPVALNKARKPIAAFITTELGRGSVYLLPPSTKGPTDEGIEVLLDIILGKKADARPRWWNTVDVPGLSEAVADLEAAKDQLTGASDQKRELEEKVTGVESYRDLVSASGDDLETVVQKVLGIMGIHTAQTQPGFPADLWDPGNIAVEITGIADKVDSDSDKMFQLQTFEEKHQKEEKIILVANTYRRIEPSARKGKIDFTPPVEDHFKRHKVCAMTGVDLLALWRRVDADPSQKEAVRRLMLSTDGVLKL